MSDTPRIDKCWEDMISQEPKALLGTEYYVARTLKRELATVTDDREHIREWAIRCQDEMEKQARRAMDMTSKRNAIEQHMALARAEAGCPDDETLVMHCRELRADLDAARSYLATVTAERDEQIAESEYRGTMVDSWRKSYHETSDKLSEMTTDLDAERTARKALVAALWRANHDCCHVGHTHADQHDYNAPCPVEARVAAALALAAKLP